MGMIPDQMMAAIHFADFVMAKEKKDRIGSSQGVICPMKFFYLHGQKEITGLIGAPFRHPGLADNDVLAMLMRVFAQPKMPRRMILPAKYVGWQERIADFLSVRHALENSNKGL